MPPNQTPNSQSRTSAIIMPGDKRILTPGTDVLAKFGTFPVVTSSDNILEDLGVIIGVYAHGGVGKTTFFCSLADPKLNPDGLFLPMCVLDSEAGIKSVAHLVAPSRLERIHVTSIAQIEEFVDTWAASPKGMFPWQSLLFDNLSDWVQKALAEQGFHNASVPGGGPTSSQPDFNAMTTRLTVILQKIRDLALDYNVNCFFNLWEQTEKTEGGAVIGHRADLTPKLAARVIGILDYIGYMTVLNNPPHWTRKLDFSPNPELDSKTRRRPDGVASKIPFEIYNPNVVDMLKTIKGGTEFPAERYKKPLNPITGR